MQLLLTRPLHQSHILADTLRQQGLTLPIQIEPLLFIHPCQEQQPALQRALERRPQAILITSINGADALAALSPRRDIPVIAVGEASCEAARRHGFEALPAGGTATEMLPFLLHRYSPENGPLLYASGETITTDITRQFADAGFAAERIIIYKALAAANLSASIKEILIAREPLAAVFYSRRTAAIFNNMIIKEQLKPHLAAAQAFVLSPAIAAAFQNLRWQAVHTAVNATQEAMIALLHTYLKGYYGKY